MSEEFALPLLMKKLQCFFEICASPTLNLSQPDSFINCQAFLSLTIFLNVLPHVFTWLGCESFFLSINYFFFLSIFSFTPNEPLIVTEVIINLFDKLVPL